MKIQKLEDLLVYQKALEGIVAISPILNRLRECNDFELYKQLSSSSGGIPGQIAEGFGQLTDRHFAHYLGIARGSAQETVGHVAVSIAKKYISESDGIVPVSLYRELAAMLTGLIIHLRKSDFRHRW